MKTIDARGNTDLAAGWAKGAAEIAPPAGAAGDGISRVLLLSDGLANRGETNAGVLAERAAALRNQGGQSRHFTHDRWPVVPDGPMKGVGRSER